MTLAGTPRRTGAFPFPSVRLDCQASPRARSAVGGRDVRWGLLRALRALPRRIFRRLRPSPTLRARLWLLAQLPRVSRPLTVALLLTTLIGSALSPLFTLLSG